MNWFDYLDEYKEQLQRQKEELQSEVSEKKDELRRLQKGLTLSELLTMYRKVYKENYGQYYSKFFQDQLRLCRERGIPENATSTFEKSNILYNLFDDLKKKIEQGESFKYLIPGDKGVKVWTGNKTGSDSKNQNK